MVNNIFLIILLALLGTTNAYAEKFIASVNKNTVAEGESIELTLRSDKQEFFSSPDLSPLEEHFDIISQHQSSQFQINNGKSVSWTDWIINLIPKRDGFVVIPPLTLDGLTTQPISIQVKNSENVKKDSTAIDPIFIESGIDIDESYVQQQIIYTIRIFHSIALFDDSKLSELKIDDVIIQPLGEVNAYTEIINGKRHGVFELRYAIYPQRSGELTIPAQTFKATTAAPRSRYEPFLNSRRGKRITVESSEITLQIKPIPKEVKNKPWIPAHSLRIEEFWSQDLDNLSPGDAVTRTITLTADGLTFAQLPIIENPALDNLKVYPDKPLGKNTLSERGIEGSNSQASAFVATTSGSYTIPATEIQWFDTDTNTVQTIILEEKVMTVADVLGSTTTPGTPSKIMPPTESSPLQPAEVVSRSKEATSNSTFWKTVSGGLLLLWLITIAWGTNRGNIFARSNNLPNTSTSSSNYANRPDEERLYQQLTSACKSNKNPHQIRDLLKSWLHALLHASASTTLKELCNSTGNDQLTNYVEELQRSLYHDGQKPIFTYSELSKLLTEVRKKSKNKAAFTSSPLKKLYG